MPTIDCTSRPGVVGLSSSGQLDPTKVYELTLVESAVTVPSSADDFGLNEWPQGCLFNVGEDGSDYETDVLIHYGGRRFPNAGGFKMQRGRKLIIGECKDIYNRGSNQVQVSPIAPQSNWRRFRRRGRSTHHAVRVVGDERDVWLNHGKDPGKGIQIPEATILECGSLTFSLINSRTNVHFGMNGDAGWPCINGPDGLFYAMTGEGSMMVGRFGVGLSMRMFGPVPPFVEFLGAFSREGPTMAYEDGYLYYRSDNQFFGRIPVSTETGQPTGPWESLVFMSKVTIHNPDCLAVGGGFVYFADEPSGVSDNLARIYKVPLVPGEIFDFQEAVDAAESGDETYTIWTAVSTSHDVEQIAIDVSAGKLFVFIDGLGDIGSMDLDGSNYTQLATPGDSECLTLDKTNQKILYADTSPDEDIISMNYDGTGPTTLVSLFTDTGWFCYDPILNRLLWNDGGTSNWLIETNVSDGSNLIMSTMFISKGFDQPDETSAALAWNTAIPVTKNGKLTLIVLDYDDDTLDEYDWDNLQLAHQTELGASWNSGASQLVYNQTDDVCYLTGDSSNRTFLYRFPLGGSGALLSPSGSVPANYNQLNWNNAEGKLWVMDTEAAAGEARIYKMNQDGSSSTLVRTITDPTANGLDVCGGSDVEHSNGFAFDATYVYYLWWTDYETGAYENYQFPYIGRMELDGSNPDDTWLDLSGLPDNFTLNAVNSRMIVGTDGNCLHTINGKRYIILDKTRITYHVQVWIELDSSGDVADLDVVRASQTEANQIGRYTPALFVNPEPFALLPEVFFPSDLSPDDWWHPPAIWSLWQDSAKTTTIIDGEGGNGNQYDGLPVGNWGSIAGDRTELANATAGERPVIKEGVAEWNYGCCMRFDGIDDDLTGSLTIPTNTAFSVAVIFRTGTTPGGSDRLAAFTSGPQFGLTTSGFIFLDNSGGAGDGISGDVDHSDGNTHLIVLTRSAAGNHTLWVDGVSLGSPTGSQSAPAISGLTINGNNHDYDYGDIILKQGVEWDSDDVTNLWAYAQRFYDATVAVGGD